MENIDNFSDPGERFVMRQRPHTLSMATSIELPVDENGEIPDDGTFDFLERTGWSGDGSPVPGTLRNFVLGAIFQHYPAVNFENREFIENGGETSACRARVSSTRSRPSCSTRAASPKSTSTRSR